MAYNKVNALFPDVSSMLKMAFELRKEAATVIEKTRFRLNVDGHQMNMRDASIHLGVPLRTVYSRLHGGRYLAAQI